MGGTTAASHFLGVNRLEHWRNPGDSQQLLVIQCKLLLILASSHAWHQHQKMQKYVIIPYTIYNIPYILNMSPYIAYMQMFFQTL
jgi:hypothetical protein